jgi:LysR family transcriptional regulator, cyn operon transcriptional activator
MSPGDGHAALAGSEPGLRITIRQLQYLIAVAEHRSFTRAAEVLYISQPTLSQQLMKLESSLRTRLIERAPHNIHLSEAGRVYAAHAARALAELREGSRALDDLANLSRGEIRLSMVPSASSLIGPALALFTAAHPEIEIVLTEQDQDTICRALAENHTDFGIGFGVPAPEQEHLGIEQRVLWREDITCVVGRGHAHYGRTSPLTLADLGQERVVLLTRPFALRRIVDDYCREQGVELKISVEVNSFETLLAAVAGGQLSTFCLEASARGRSGVCPVPVVPELGATDIALLWKRDQYQSMACRAFREVLESTVAPETTPAPTGLPAGARVAERGVRYPSGFWRSRVACFEPRAHRFHAACQSVLADDSPHDEGVRERDELALREGQRPVYLA